MMTYRRDSEIPIPFGYYREGVPAENHGNTTVDLSKKKDLIVWIASNCFQMTWPRLPFIKQLSKFLPVRAYGGCGNLTCLPLRSHRCNQVFNGFKFHLALANSECREYITEKFWTNSLLYDAPREDFEKLAPPNSFIHVSDFSTLEDLADLKCFEWKKKGVVTPYFPVTLPTLCNIIPHLFNGTTQPAKTIKDSVWYTVCRETRSTRMFLTKTLPNGYNSPNTLHENHGNWSLFKRIFLMKDFIWNSQSCTFNFKILSRLYKTKVFLLFMIYSFLFPLFFLNCWLSMQVSFTEKCFSAERHSCSKIKVTVRSTIRFNQNLTRKWVRTGRKTHFLLGGH